MLQWRSPGRDQKSFWRAAFLRLWCFLSSIRLCRAPREGFVGFRGFGGRTASRTSRARRSRAISRLRYWLRSVSTCTCRTPPVVMRDERFFSRRARRVGPTAAVLRSSQRRVTRLLVLLTPCPPAPEARLAVNCNSRPGMINRLCTIKSSIIENSSRTVLQCRETAAGSTQG